METTPQTTPHCLQTIAQNELLITHFDKYCNSPNRIFFPILLWLSPLPTLPAACRIVTLFSCQDTWKTCGQLSRYPLLARSLLRERDVLVFEGERGEWSH